MESTLVETTVTGIGGLNVLVLLLLASFAIERVATAVVFTLSYVPWWERRFPNPATADREPARAARLAQNQRLVRVLFACALAALVVSLDERLRVLFALGVNVAEMRASLQTAVDAVLTVILLVGGSDLLGRMLDISGRMGGGGSASAPVEIKGTLVLENDPEPRGSVQPTVTAS